MGCSGRLVIRGGVSGAGEGGSERVDGAAFLLRVLQWETTGCSPLSADSYMYCRCASRHAAFCPRLAAPEREHGFLPLFCPVKDADGPTRYCGESQKEVGTALRDGRRAPVTEDHSNSTELASPLGAPLNRPGVASIYARSSRVRVARKRQIPCVAKGTYEMTQLTSECSHDGRGLCSFSPCGAQPGDLRSGNV
jgi:hypothetical protein